nr:hypothetical protein [uncultured Pseudomonas sp.]
MLWFGTPTIFVGQKHRQQAGSYKDLPGAIFDLACDGPAGMAAPLAGPSSPDFIRATAAD